MAKGSTTNQKPGGSRGLRKQMGGIADWQTADPGLVLSVIERAAITGGAVRFGYSRDGGAYAIGIYGDGDPYTEYCKPSEDLNEFLTLVLRLYDAIYDDQMSQRKS